MFNNSQKPIFVRAINAVFREPGPATPPEYHTHGICGGWKAGCEMCAAQSGPENLLIIPYGDGEGRYTSPGGKHYAYDSTWADRVAR